jgi:uncharacterized transporter YbjL
MKLLLAYSVIITLVSLWFLTIFAMLKSSDLFLMSMGALFGTFTLTVIISIVYNLIKDRL